MHLEITDFQQGETFSITHEKWTQLSDLFARWGVFVLFLFMFFSLFIGLIILNFILAFFVAIAVFAVTALMDTQLDFAACMRVASAMRIPVNVIGSLGMFISVLHITSITSWIIWLFYLIFSTWSTRPYAKAIR